MASSSDREDGCLLVAEARKRVLPRRRVGFGGTICKTLASKPEISTEDDQEAEDARSTSQKPPSGAVLWHASHPALPTPPNLPLLVS